MRRFFPGLRALLPLVKHIDCFRMACVLSRWSEREWPLQSPTIAPLPLQRRAGGLTGQRPPLLPVIIVHFNPFNFTSRVSNTLEQQSVIGATEGAVGYTIELAFADDPFQVTDSRNPRHLQLRLRNSPPLFYKHNLVNIAVDRLLPPDWTCYAFVDSEVRFSNPRWAIETAALLTDGRADAVQPFSVVDALGPPLASMAAWLLDGHVGSELDPMFAVRVNDPGQPFAGHSGYSWALNRRAHAKGLFDKSVSGCDDAALTFTLTGRGLYFTNLGAPYTQSMTRDWNSHIAEYRRHLLDVRLGFVRGAATHVEHGAVRDRDYVAQCVLLEHFEPTLDLQYNSDGLLLPTPHMSQGLVIRIERLLRGRNEDGKPLSAADSSNYIHGVFNALRKHHASRLRSRDW
jgi:hypothetical protein